jgi:UDP-N-acetylmuramate dehydrogenase
VTSAGLDALADELGATFGDRVERNAPSAALTTYRCGGPLALLVRVHREHEFEPLARALGREPTVDVLVVGRGSNLLVADAGFAGVAIALAGDFEQLAIDPANAHVDAGAAVALPVLARQAAAAGVGALEFFVGIPGSVGGAVRMNAGGHGADTNDVVRSARVATLDDGRVRVVERDGLGLGYRASALGPRHVVVAASFAGRGDDPAACARRIDEIVRWRREHQPGGQNAGSVFTNPPDDAAGRLIEASGCKGMRVGGAVVSEKHANFFVAEPGARAGDVYALIGAVRDRVYGATGTHLEPELRLVGFARHDEEVSR